MRGGIQKKGDRYYAVVYDGIDPGTGRKRRRWVAAGTRRADAERLLADLIRRKYEGEPVPTEKLTLAEYLTERWLPVQKTRLRASTYDSYRRNVELHVIPALGRRPLDRLTVEDVDLFYAELLTKGRKKRPGEKGEPKGLSPKSVHNIHVMLNKALGRCRTQGQRRPQRRGARGCAVDQRSEARRGQGVGGRSACPVPRRDRLAPDGARAQLRCQHRDATR